MKYIVEDDYLNSNNILISIEKMPNTELRYRLKIDDNTLYSVTKSGDNLSWQNSHYHKCCNELYIVQKGKILIVLKEKDEIFNKVLIESQMLVVKPNIPHNIYMYEDTQFCVLKYGDVKEKDWYADEELDEFCKKIDIKELKQTPS